MKEQTAGKRIRETRRRGGMSQQEFGERIGISQSRVSEIENGRATPTNQTLKLVSLICGVEEDWLKYGDAGKPVSSVEPQKSQMVEIFEDKDKLRAFRKSLGLTQREFGERLGCSVSHITNMECGRRRASKTLVMLAELVYGG